MVGPNFVNEDNINCSNYVRIFTMQRTIQYDLRIQKSTHDRMLILKYEHIELIYRTSKKKWCENRALRL